ncbi:MAG TPA: hypothetical protein ENJ84_02535 [Gammaproteobacteria bacterium]|nr:hypothetical protein [Gammaproteobacteria bacterium]
MSRQHTLFLFPILILLLLFASGCQDTTRTDNTTATKPLPLINTNPYPFDSSSENGDNINSPMGINSNYVTDWTPEWVFVDAFKKARPWISGTLGGAWDNGETLDLDTDGWVRSLQPNQVARTLMFRSQNGHYPSGQYTVLYDGQGRIAYSGDARLNTILSQPGRDILDVTPGNAGIILEIEQTNPSDYIRNIRVIMPGGVCSNDPYRYCQNDATCGNNGICESFVDNYQTQIFHPTFLKRNRRYSLYRFMNWMRTNGSEQQNWSDRPRTTDAMWSSNKGVPVEVMIALANRLHAAPWFNIPHMATDEYVREFSRIVHDHLSPDLQVYIEYSNETWNGHPNFTQSRYVEAQGQTHGLGNGDPNLAGIQFTSRQAVRIFDIFTSTFGDTDRLVRVMASHARNAWRTEQLLSFEDAWQKTDAIAIAPYFGARLGRRNVVLNEQIYTMTVPQLIEQLRNVEIPEALNTVSRHAQIAQKYSLKLLTYEAGQHLVRVGSTSYDNQVDRLFDAVNRDPAMADLYRIYMEGWKNNGGHLFVNFSNVSRFSIYGRWGLLEYQDQPASEAPKYQASMDFIQNNPKWW